MILQNLNFMRFLSLSLFCNSYSDDDSDSPKKTHSEMSLAELNQSLRMSLPRPKSGEFRKLFEGNSP
jgi:hypothetical protein